MVTVLFLLAPFVRGQKAPGNVAGDACDFADRLSTCVKLWGPYWGVGGTLNDAHWLPQSGEFSQLQL